MTGRSLRRRSVGSISGLIVSSRRTRCGVPGLIRTRRTPPDRPVRTVSANPPAETGFFPAEVKCAVSYGPRMHAVGAYLLNVHYLPVARTAAVFKGLFQLPVSTGWVSVPGAENFPPAGRHRRVNQAGCHGSHGLCNAHHLRALQKIREDTPELGWAKQMTDFLVGTHRQVQAAKARGHTSLSKEAHEALWHGYREILTKGMEHRTGRRAVRASAVDRCIPDTDCRSLSSA